MSGGEGGGGEVGGVKGVGVRWVDTGRIYFNI